jgi:hypothetical protein
MALRPDPNAVLRRVGGGAVLVHLGTSQVFELNGTASRVWELAATGAARPSIVETLASEYDGERESIARDVDELIDVWIAKGLLSA